MATIERGIYDIGYLDTLADHDSLIHRLDPRAKVLTTVVFIIMVASAGKYEIARLIPYLLLPVMLTSLGGISGSYLLRKIVLVCPFVFFVAIVNPFLDRAPMCEVAGLSISGGWISFASIMLRFVLTVSVALILVATTGFARICQALEQLGIPRTFTVQLSFLYRYIFVLMDEGVRMVRAHALRSGGGKIRLATYKQLAGSLLLRTIERAERIHTAMLCRGFAGEIRTLRHSSFGRADALFTLTVSMILILFRCVNVPQLLGAIFLEIFL